MALEEKSKKKKKVSKIKDKKDSLKEKNARNDSTDIDKSDKSSLLFSTLEVVVVSFISIIFGVIIGYMITYGNRVSRFSFINEIVNTYSDILENYYEEVDEKELANAAIKGMVESLGDNYSVFMDGDFASDFNEKVEGAFEGIGAVVTFNGDYNQVLSLYDDSPAMKAGLQEGDIIVEVDGQDVKGLFGDELSKLIKGKKGTKVNIVVKRNDEEISFVLKRDLINLISVHSEIMNQDDKKIGYIKIDVFSSNTYSQFVKALNDLESEKVYGLVLDIRDNYGGYLTQTKDILDLFFPKKTLLYQLESKNNNEKFYDKTKENRNYPVVILVNGMSASSSEVLASCFQENYKNSVIVGIQSRGKGTVQKSQSLFSDSNLKFTIQKWLTSKGIWLNGVGVTPDYVVEQSSEYFQNPIFDNDKQLQVALEKVVNIEK